MHKFRWLMPLYVGGVAIGMYLSMSRVPASAAIVTLKSGSQYEGNIVRIASVAESPVAPPVNGDRKPVVVIETSMGTMRVELEPELMPNTTANFLTYVDEDFYSGTLVHRVVPNFVLQGGSPDANEYVGHPDYMRDELGQWPHVRGALGISTRGRDTGDAQFFIDLLDNPRLDHQYTVFGQVIAGIDVADRVLEGDVIESVQILDERKTPR